MQFLSPKFKGYIDLVRPFTLVAPVVGGAAGAVMGYSHVHHTLAGIDWRNIVGGCISLALVNAASNSLNNVYDIEIDRINKPERPLPAGVVTKDEAFTISWMAYMVALFRALLTGTMFGAFVFLIMITTVFYSLPPIRLKQRLWLSNISIAFARGLLGMVAAWSITVDVLEVWDPWAIGIVTMVFLIGSTTTKDFTDIPGDKKFGMKTLPVVYGIRKATVMSAPFLILAFALIPVGVALGDLINWSMYLVVLVGWSSLLIYQMLRAPKGGGALENSSVWRQMYFMLMTLQGSFAVIYIWHGLQG